MKSIPQRELRNRIGEVLRQVEAGQPIRITVNGRAVADLVPIEGPRRAFLPKDRVKRLLAHAPLDRKFLRDIEAVAGARIDEV